MTHLETILALGGSNSEVAPFPGDEQQKLPPVPHNSPAKEMFTAHRVDDMMRQLAHCRERLQAIKTVPPSQRQYHLIHVNNHLSACVQHGQALADNLKRNYPPEWQELQHLQKTVALARAFSPEAKVATTAHLTQTVLYHLGHAKRHALVMEGANSSDKLWDFNCAHCETHVEGAAEHAQKLCDHLRDNYPEEGEFLDGLQVPEEANKLTPLTGSLERILALTPETPTASTVPKPIGRPNGPGLWHHKHWMLPPYIQHVAHALMRHGHGESDAIHMAVGIVKHWAEGHDGHGHKTHPDVRAAASANVAKWEELRARAAGSHAAKEASRATKSSHDLAASAWSDQAEGALELVLAAANMVSAQKRTQPRYTLPPFPNQPGPLQSSFLKGGTAPGARPLNGMLVHVPSQTVQAGPPLPPDVKVPTAAELNAFAAEIKRTLPAGDLCRSAVHHAEAAATKMAANQPIDALHLLKNCQTDLVSAHRDFNATQIPIANVFSSSLVPAEQSSAQSQMYEGLDTRAKYRALTTECGILRDRIRRHWFHGMYNHMGDARFTETTEPEDPMSRLALDRMLRLAADGDAPGPAAGMIYLEIPQGLLPPGYPREDMPLAHVTVVYLGPNISQAQFENACRRTDTATQAIPALHGVIAGLGYFDPEDKDKNTRTPGKRTAFAPVKLDAVHQFRALLGDLAYPTSKPFIPHVTLAYLDPGEAPPPPVTNATLCISQACVRRGTQMRAFAFRGHVHGGNDKRQAHPVPAPGERVLPAAVGDMDSIGPSTAGSENTQMTALSRMRRVRVSR